MPIDARGAAISRVAGRPFVAVEEPGLVDESYYRLLPGACYDHKHKLWLLPINSVARPNGNHHAPRARHTPSKLPLREYQAADVDFVVEADSGAVIALVTGLGKTIEALQAIAEHPEAHRRPFLICGPLLSAGAWVGPNADPAKHYGLQVAQGTTNKPSSPEGAINAIFINYDVLPAWAEWVNTVLRPAAVILDEAHVLRNPRTAAYKAARKVTRPHSVALRLALTATPVVNSVVDLWAVLDLVQPHAWGEQVNQFAIRYNGAFEGEYGIIQGESETNVDELRARLRSVLLRRTFADVRREIPDLMRTCIRVDHALLDPTALAAYEACGAGLITEDGLASGAALTAINGMLLHLSEAKRPAALEAAHALCNEHHKVYINTWYRETAAWLAKQLALRGVTVFGPIDSNTTKPKRDRLFEELVALDSHGHDGIALVGTLGSTGMSRNELACCSGALTVDLWYVPATLLQAEGRLRRGGQKAKEIDWRYLIANETADEVMFRYLEKKSAAMAGALNDDSGSSLCEALGGRDEEQDLAQFVAALEAMKEKRHEEE
jgi:hypothetical protein